MTTVEPIFKVEDEDSDGMWALQHPDSPLPGDNDNLSILPPQILVLTLTTEKLIFLFLRETIEENARNMSPLDDVSPHVAQEYVRKKDSVRFRFVSAQINFPTNLEYTEKLGTFMTVDPRFVTTPRQ